MHHEHANHVNQNTKRAGAHAAPTIIATSLLFLFFLCAFASPCPSPFLFLSAFPSPFPVASLVLSLFIFLLSFFVCLSFPFYVGFLFLLLSFFIFSHFVTSF